MDGDTVKIVSGVAGIVIIECVALSQGIDGAILMGSFAVIGGIVGYIAKEMQQKYQIETSPLAKQALKAVRRR